MQTSTFVLMFGMILPDAVAYLIIMIYVFLMVGHAFSVMLRSDYCGETYGICGDDIPDATKHCLNFSSISSTLTLLFGMVMGNYDDDNFPTTFTKWIVILFMFMFVVVM